jgi:hypothetical protein
LPPNLKSQNLSRYNREISPKETPADTSSEVIFGQELTLGTKSSESATGLYNGV